MSSCLGLYIENNVIKYAKVTKDREILKIEAFGLKFYEKIGEALNQIVSETFSYNIPISVNMSEEIYNYFYMFSLLNKNDLKKAIDTEFESYCYDKKLNRNAFETRYAISNEQDDKDKIKIIHVSANKSSISKTLQTLNDYKVSTVTPIGTSIANIASIKPKENIMIVNIEDKTTVTTIINQKIYNVMKLEEGAGEILEKIASKENSYSKAYEICKNSTIYTMEGKELQELLLIPMDFVVNIQYVDNIVLNLEKLRLKYLQKQIKDTFLENLFDLIEPTLKKNVYDLFLSGNYAEAVEAGCKDINAELKRIYGIDKVGNLDGDSLITKMLSPNNPILKITKGNSVSDKNIQKGYMMMLQGMWAAIRDPKAHENIIIEKEDAIEKLCFLSMLLRKIKKATKIEVTEEEN